MLTGAIMRVVMIPLWLAVTAWAMCYTALRRGVALVTLPFRVAFNFVVAPVRGAAALRAGNLRLTSAVAEADAAVRTLEAQLHGSEREAADALARAMRAEEALLRHEIAAAGIGGASAGGRAIHLGDGRAGNRGGAAAALPPGDSSRHMNAPPAAFRDSATFLLGIQRELLSGMWVSGALAALFVYAFYAAPHPRASLDRRLGEQGGAGSRDGRARPLRFLS